MPTYDIYLETAPEGICLAHVLGLPGCVVRGINQEAALAALPEAIRDYHTQLQAHGETVAMPDLIDLHIAEEQHGLAPIDPQRGKAALFAPDRQPLDAAEVERYLCHAEYNRTGLLALTRDLSDTALDWQASPDEMSIRQILHHIATAERYYISRIVPRAQLPATWKHDRDLPVDQYLADTRCDVAALFRQLDEQQRSDLFTPNWWTQQPEEEWTARKALRRLLEHEREHTWHILEVLAAIRVHLLARMAAERADLLLQYISLDEVTLDGPPVFDDWTAKHLLAHIAAWDALFACRTRLVLAGRAAEVEQVDLDARNAMLHDLQKDWPLEQSLAVLLKERSSYRTQLKQAPDALLHKHLRLTWTQDATLYDWAQWRWGHDATHANDLRQWRQQQAKGVGPKSILRAAFRATRREILTLAALIPEHQRDSRPVCGVWTLKDVLGHIADWEQYAVSVLPQIRAEGTHSVEGAASIQDFNDAHAAVRRDQPWDMIWDDYLGIREQLVAILDDMPQDEYARPVTEGWSGKQTTIYRWLLIWLHHEHEHAADLRRVLNPPDTPERLMGG